MQQDKRVWQQNRDLAGLQNHSIT
ncbi:unnamed protein product [Tuber melanosporum]|uniref:(Perigord truffle) hypothetical protein n=1 Tax=Tuber melanosporum (strain Mel28) TaxID=656061 RepID=D5GBF1_TUBMM|nr:unnamed protein product [Tuber melanosporum]